MDIVKKITIYEPAMCCPTGLCGVGIDPELLRISTLQNTLKKTGVEMERFNLSNAPQEFINNKAVNKFINENGVEKLPLTVIDDEIVVAGRYPTDDEVAKLLNITIEQPKSADQPKRAKIKSKRTGGCGCSGGNCC